MPFLGAMLWIDRRGHLRVPLPGGGWDDVRALSCICFRCSHRMSDQVQGIFIFCVRVFFSAFKRMGVLVRSFKLLEASRHDGSTRVVRSAVEVIQGTTWCLEQNSRRADVRPHGMIDDVFRGGGLAVACRFGVTLLPWTFSKFYISALASKSRASVDVQKKQIQCHVKALPNSTQVAIPQQVG